MTSRVARNYQQISQKNRSRWSSLRGNLDFDEQLSTIMPPHYALLLCFSNYKKVEELMKPFYDKLESEDCKKSAELPFFMKQNISNACGTFALFHAIAHNADKSKSVRGALVIGSRGRKSECRRAI
uniref:ubiquitinyl hydrolase 1 n=1 Tax=Ditylenchus dipsaci TaxID=166011 RepID=A0A915D509_9BILA